MGGGNQDYALIIGVNPAPPVGSGLLVDADFSAGLPAGWSVQTASGVPWTIRTPIPGGTKYDNLTGGTGNFAMVDNNYSNDSLTSLRTPVLDLSSTDAAVLSFRSNFYFDLLETINVDVSTNGGASWANVWQWIGFNPLPTNYVLDLTGSITGHAEVMIRFRYDSGGDIQGNYWQVDDVQLEVFGGEPPPAGTVHLAGIQGAALPASNGRWAVEVGFLVENQDGVPESGVTVDGAWSNGANGGGSCVTGVGGNCTVTKNNLKKNVNSVDFTVTGLSKAGMTYDPAGNEVGTSLTVSQNDTDQVPSAYDDNYATDVGVALNGNVMDNDDEGVKGGGATYLYEVCETGTSHCASATANF